MSKNPLTNQVAKKALDKLDAKDDTPKGAAHSIYAVYHDGRLVARTGLRRSSNRDIPVPHVKDDLRVSVHFVLDLARCPKDKQDWLRELGIIPDEDEPEVEDDEPRTSSPEP